jgi:hypothetical protein
MRLMLILAALASLGCGVLDAPAPPPASPTPSPEPSRKVNAEIIDVGGYHEVRVFCHGTTKVFVMNDYRSPALAVAPGACRE